MKILVGVFKFVCWRAYKDLNMVEATNELIFQTSMACLPYNKPNLPAQIALLVHFPNCGMCVYESDKEIKRLLRTYVTSINITMTSEESKTKQT